MNNASETSHESPKHLTVSTHLRFPFLKNDDIESFPAIA